MGRIRFTFTQSTNAHILSSIEGSNTNGGSNKPVYTFPRPPICRYWKAGYCKRAEKCHFFHDPDSHSAEQYLISADEADEATTGGKWRLKAARRQMGNDAGNDINVKRR